MIGREPVGQQPTEGVAAHDDSLVLERIQQPDHVKRVVFHRVAARRRVAVAASTHVERKHASGVPRDPHA